MPLKVDPFQALSAKMPSFADFENAMAQKVVSVLEDYIVYSQKVLGRDYVVLDDALSNAVNCGAFFPSDSHVAAYILVADPHLTQEMFLDYSRGFYKEETLCEFAESVCRREAEGMLDGLGQISRKKQYSIETVGKIIDLIRQTYPKAFGRDLSINGMATAFSPYAPAFRDDDERPNGSFDSFSR